MKTVATWLRKLADKLDPPVKPDDGPGPPKPE